MEYGYAGRSMCNTITVVHTNDPTTRVLSALYEARANVARRVTEEYTNSGVIRALRECDVVMMLGHGNEYGLFSTPNKKGVYERRIINESHVQFLRDKTCIGIWCHSVAFAEKYGLHGLFSGMIVSEPEEAEMYHISATEEDINCETEKFARRLRFCMEHYGLEEVPIKMKELDDMKSELTRFNYNNLFYLG